MCGFAGVISWNDHFRTSRNVLAKMQAAIAHRGPDGQGDYFNHEGEATDQNPQCAMAFCRLAILDPDPRAMQPFHLLDGAGRPRLSVVFNGEIYNFRELKAELSRKRPDYAWRTTCDTEVLLMAYDVWREDCLPRLDGMFAFAIWDQTEHSLFLARDRMGQKPLYIAAKNGVTAFASELGALTKLPWLDRTINLSALADYLTWGYIGRPQTIYAGAEKLSPATWKKFTGSSSTQAHYFDPNALDPPQSRIVPGPDQNTIASTRSLLTAAVQRQMISDVPIGCFLSGGIDSSIIAAAMQQSAPEPIHTFSIGFDEPEYDESRYAAAVAKHLGTIHHEFHIHPDAGADLPRLAAVFAEPFADSSALPAHYLSQQTRQHVKVALSGDGGDELFAGYDRYHAIALDSALQKIPFPLRNISAALGKNLGGQAKSPRLRLSRFLSSINQPAASRYASYLRLFNKLDIANLWPAGLDAIPGTDITADFVCLSAHRDVLQTALAVDRITYLPDDLLTKLDRASMLHALEVRSPFMDPALINFAALLNREQLLGKGSKTLLRQAFAADLPAEVFRRKKMGFAVPIGKWFRSSLREMLHEKLFASDSFGTEHFNRNVLRRIFDEHQTHHADHSQRLYALLMLELWWENAKQIGLAIAEHG